MVSLMEQLIVLLPKPSAVLSMIGSYGLIRELFADQFYRRRGHHGTGNKVIPRALFTLSMADLFHSFAWFLTTWPSPKELSSYVWLASGNTATCTFQGFLVQFGFLWSLGSNCILFLWYLLILRYNWPNSRLCKMEPWVHVVVFLAVFWSSAVPLFYGMYNNWFAICYIVEYPLGCRGNDCIRGKYAWIVNDLFGMIPVWGTVGFSVLTMSLIFCSVRRLERRNAQYAGSRSVHQMSMSTHYNTTTMETSYTANSTLDSQQRDSLQQQRQQDQDDVQRINREKSRAVAAQGYCYFAAFIATYVLDLVGKIIMWTSQKYIWNLNLVSLAIIPLQGFFNFLVFCRTRKDMKTPEGKLLRSLLCCSTCFPCLRSTFLHWLGSSRTSNSSDNNNNNNNNNSNTNDRRNTSSKKTPPTSNAASLRRVTAPGAPVVVQVGATAKDQQQRRPGARISESVEIAFEPDSQFERRPNGSAISNLTPTTATTRSDHHHHHHRINNNNNYYPSAATRSSGGASEVIVFSPDSQFEASSSTAAATVVSVAAATAASTALPPTVSEAEAEDEGDVGCLGGEAVAVAKPERDDDDAEGPANNNPATAAASDTTSSTSTTSATNSSSRSQQQQQQNPLSFLQPPPPSSPLLEGENNNNNNDHDDNNDNNPNNDDANDNHDDDNSSTRSSSSQRRASF